jgi:hypothetical protein
VSALESILSSFAVGVTLGVMAIAVMCAWEAHR